MDRKKIGILILAAGASRRLGQPKQNIVIGKNTLLQNTIEAALGVVPQVYVILGAHAESIEPDVKQYAAQILHNPNWEEGMGGSIRFGVQSILEKQVDIEGLIVSVCDQPKLSYSIFEALLTKHQETHKAIVAASYGGRSAVPAFFHVSFFRELLQCKGDMGARRLFANYPNACTNVPFEDGIWDVDRVEDIMKI